MSVENREAKFLISIGGVLAIVTIIMISRGMESEPKPRPITPEEISEMLPLVTQMVPGVEYTVSLDATGTPEFEFTVRTQLDATFTPHKEFNADITATQRVVGIQRTASIVPLVTRPTEEE